MKIRHVLLHLVCSAAFVFFAEAALAATAGHIQFVNGDVQVINPSGITHALQKGDAINEGDTISSAKEASAQVKMADGGFIAVRQETQLKFDSFKVALKQGDQENSFFSLVKGSFRAVTGLIGRVNKQNYKITTPVATIGIRGTDHETAFVPNALPGVPAGAYSKVNVGETSLTTGAGTINVKPNQMGYAGGLNQPPKLVPINTSLFTVAAAPASGAKKEDKKDKEDKGGGQQGQQTAQNGTKEDKGGKEGEGSNGSGGGEPIRDTAVVDNTSKSGAATSTAPATTTTVTTAETAVTTVSAPPQTTIPVTATNNSLTLDTTNQTVTAGGSTVSVQNGTYGIDAKTAADAAKAAADAANAVAAAASTINTQVTALTSANTAPATSAIATANGTITAASPLVTSATAITPVGAATAASNAATAQAAATAAASKASAAQAALTANGAFADSLAGPANTATASANTALQAANSSLQAAAATVTAQNTALTTAQTSASTALTAANTNLTAANASLTTANTNNASIASAQSAASGLASQVATAASLAQAAANAALAAAAQVISLQTAGDFTGAAAQLAIAQQQQAIAQQQLVIAQNASTTLSSQLTAATTAQTNANNAVTAAVSAANTAAANAGTGTTGAQSYVSAAQTAATSASSALATTSSLLPTVTSNAPIVAANAPIAAYYNPKVAGGSFIGATMLSVPASGGGFNAAFPPATLPQLNTAYVLDGSGNLAEMRNSQFRVQANQNGGWLTPNIIGTSGADIKWSGGTGADAFNLSDNSIYLGRWSGAIVTVTDNANTANVYTYTPADNIWLVALPPPTGYVQTLVGTTTYTKAGNTTPVDAFGNLGVLNSATLTANFTSQLVTAGVNLTMGAASPMGGTYAVTGANLPINGGGFDIYSGSSQPGTLTISCSGTCAATGTTGYSAELGGGFAGTAAASAAMSYAIWPTTAATSPVTDAVQGFVAFTAATAPTGPTVAAYTATSTAVAYTGSYGGGFNFIAAPGEVTPLSNPTTFTENYGGGSGFRTDVLTGTSTATPPVTTANGISFGVWDTVTTVSTHEHHLITPNNGGSYPHAYMYGLEGYLDSSVTMFNGTTGNTGPLVGTFNYNKVAMTSYDMNTWAAGTATSASMSADFTHQTASVALAGMMGTTSWTSAGSGMPINMNTTNGTMASFNSSTPIITVNTVACASCGGNINGSFVGQNYAGAIVQYGVWDNSNTATKGLNVDGLVAFDRLSVSGNPAVSTAAPNSSMTTYVLGTNSYNVERPTAITLGTGGVLTGWGVSTFNSTVAPAAGSVAQTAVGSGSGTINWGEWASGSVADSTFSYAPGPAQIHWITAPEPTPFYLAEVLTTTSAAYNFINGDVTSLIGGVHGTVNGGTSLTVNFATQSVAANLDLTVNTHHWLASTSNAPLQSLNSDSRSGFYADSYRLSSQPGYLTVTVDAVPASGDLAGQLVGTALNGAFLKFNLNGQVTTPTIGFDYVQGVAALGAATPNDPLAPYKIAVALVNDPIVTDGNGRMVGGYQVPTNVTFDGLGNLTKLSDSDKHATTIALSAGTSGSAFTGTSTAAGTACSPSPCTDAVTGVVWGRWAPGVTATVTEAGAPKNVTINGGGVHWIATPTALTGPVTLPVSGTYAYTVAGGTNPTDSTGAVGTLNSASLSANFTAQTVDVGVNATVATTTINASATGVPISKGAIFNADSSSGLTVGCTGTACSGAKGGISGGFGGAGAMGAVMMYGFLPNPLANPLTSNMITGVVAFHR